MQQAQSKKPKVTAIVLSYNNFSDTQNCIDSLLKTDYDNLEVILVDNASKDGSKEKILKEYPRIPLICSDVNLGYAGGLNLGIKEVIKSQAEYILLANNDLVFTPGFLQPLVEIAESHPAIGIVSPKVLYVDHPDTIYCAGGEMKPGRCVGVAMYQGKPAALYGNEIREITLAEGCCLLVKKQVIEKIGLMEEKYFMYYEDHDFSRRASKYYKIFYNPASIIYHKSGAGKNWAEFSPLYYFYFTKNRLWFYADSNFFYKMYVIAFSFINVSAKSLVLLFNYIKNNNRQNIGKSLKSLWKGFGAGILGILKISPQIV